MALHRNLRNCLTACSTVALSALLFAAGGCGSGSSSSGGSASTTTPPSLETQSMGAAADTNLNTASTQATAADTVEGAAFSAGAVSDVTTTNDLLSTTNTWLAATTTKAATSRAATNYSVTVDGVTATVGLTPVNLTTYDYTVTLNGTVTGTSTTYSNFVFATGVAARGTNGAESGTHYTTTYNQLKSGATATLATSDTWVYSDGSGIGSISYASTGTTVAWQSTTDGVWNWSLYQGGDATTGKLRGKVTVNADDSGSASLYCTTDETVRSTASWSATGSGQFCRFVTACTPNGDRPCVSYP